MIICITDGSDVMWKDEGKTVIIKDYAFKMVPDYFIITGDTVDEVSAVSSHNSITADVCWFQSIYTSSDGWFFIDCRFILFDLSGQAILQKKNYQKKWNYPGSPNSAEII